MVEQGALLNAKKRGKARIVATKEPEKKEEAPVAPKPKPEKVKIISIFPVANMPIKEPAYDDKGELVVEKLIRGNQIVEVPVWKEKGFRFDKHAAYVSREQAEDLKKRQGYGVDFMSLEDWKAMRKHPKKKGRARWFAEEAKRRNKLWGENVFTDIEMELFEVE